MRGEEKFYTFFELALPHHDQGEHYRKEASVGFIVAGPSWHGNVSMCVCKDNLSMSVKSGIVLWYSTNKLAALWFLRIERLRTGRCTRAIMTQLLLCLQLATAV